EIGAAQVDEALRLADDVKSIDRPAQDRHLERAPTEVVYPDEPALADLLAGEVGAGGRDRVRDQPRLDQPRHACGRGERIAPKGSPTGRMSERDRRRGAAVTAAGASRHEPEQLDE